MNKNNFNLGGKYENRNYKKIVDYDYGNSFIKY